MPEDKDGSDSSKASDDDDLFFFGWRQAALTFGMFFPFFARFPPLLLALRRRTCSSLRPLINYCATSAFGKAPLSEKSYYCGAANSLGWRSVGRPLSSLLFLSISRCNVAPHFTCTEWAVCRL